MDDEVMCEHGHVHKDERSADRCNEKNSGRRRAREERDFDRVMPVLSEEGHFYINRRGKRQTDR